MKSYQTLLFSLIIFGGSTDDEPAMVETGLPGKWNLTEQLLYPGDCRGTFQPVPSDKTLFFLVTEKYVQTQTYAARVQVLTIIAASITLNRI
ncbi:hypothetical protein FNH22_22075 [Fulvivirga sp. M361]|uniref:hypothetical protein n=1 Tax=Fulvivirga sp. M361 TaxID=2594266 RepID=UPI00117A914F|nr:hypothetical protein [Fulvivirga sp. M361]TRX52402.1 hypothetical protein FNH22_22075 [Fulvivirga sp. M361]